jgi:hypothetical protein
MYLAIVPPTHPITQPIKIKVTVCRVLVFPIITRMMMITVQTIAHPMLYAQ